MESTEEIIDSDYPFNDFESSVIMQYTQESPPSINFILRGDSIPIYKGQIKRFIAMIESFSKLELSEDEVVVYRGIHIDDISIVDNEFITDHLISTTDELDVAQKFAGEDTSHSSGSLILSGRTILKITLPVGIPILYIGLLSHKYTRFLLEGGEEMILLPGKFTITDVKVENDTNIIECRYSQYRDVNSTLDLLLDRVIDMIEI